jgi:hypothetical protein
MKGARRTGRPHPERRQSTGEATASQGGTARQPPHSGYGRSAGRPVKPTASTAGRHAPSLVKAHLGSLVVLRLACEAAG